MKTAIILASLAVGALASASCVTYDAPPESRLVQPDGGSFTAGQPVEIRFSEPIEAETLSVNIWLDVRDIENEIPAGEEPLVAGCQGECDDVTVAVADNGRSVELTLNPDTLGKPGVPLLVEILPGLEDLEGNDTGASDFFAVKFRPPDDRFNEEPVDFQDGVYILVAQVNDPLPATLTLISDVQVTQAGDFRLAGAEGDATDGAPKNTQDPTKIIVDTTNDGWAAFAGGFIKLEDGRRFLRSDKFDVALPIIGLLVKLDGVRLDAEVTRSEETGNDRLEGTLSYEALRLVNGDRETVYEGGNTALIADWVPPEVAPEGHPLVCGDLCGTVVGLCSPPADFPGASFCELD